MKNNTLTLNNVEILEENGFSTPKSIVIEDGTITNISTQPQSGSAIDGSGLKALPGIIDIHGDGFEYHMSPRAGTPMPIDMAVMSNDMALISAGITTFFYSITDGFEPGIRSRKTVREILRAVEKNQHSMKANVRFHIRHEQANTSDHDELLDWIKTGRIHLLSLNNHLPDLNDEKKLNRYIQGFQRRISDDKNQALDMIKGFHTQIPTGAEQTKELSATAQKYKLCLASHDDKTEDDYQRALDLGVNIAEFPINLDMAQRFQEQGISVLMGAPNAVRGKSHVSAVSTRDAIQAGVLDILVSDYHYPSLYHAPFLLNTLGIIDFPTAWALVSKNPANAVGLGKHKGIIATGMDADLLLISGMSGLVSDLQAVIRDGKIVLNTGL